MGWLRSRSSLQLALTVLVALVLAYGLQRYVVGIFRVPSGSMARTLLPGDRLLAARFWYSIERPTRGDIVVLHPNGKGDRVFYADTASRRVFVKRIIGLPGDWVKARRNLNIDVTPLSLTPGTEERTEGSPSVHLVN